MMPKNENPENDPLEELLKKLKEESNKNNTKNE